MDLIKKIVPVPVVVETEYTVKFTHSELLEIRSALGRTSGTYSLYQEIRKALGEI